MIVLSNHPGVQFEAIQDPSTWHPGTPDYCSMVVSFSVTLNLPLDSYHDAKDVKCLFGRKGASGFVGNCYQFLRGMHLFPIKPVWWLDSGLIIVLNRGDSEIFACSPAASVWSLLAGSSYYEFPTWIMILHALTVGCACTKVPLSRRAHLKNRKEVIIVKFFFIDHSSLLS